MRIVFTIAGLDPEFGGPSRSVPALARVLAEAGLDVELLACESEPGHSAPIPSDSRSVNAHFVPARSRRGRWWASRNDFHRVLCDRASGPDAVIHDNGLWLPTNHAVAVASTLLGRPRVVSPRGMLSGWATRHRWWKKRLAWALYQRRDLLSASLLHATSAGEAEDCRRAGFRGPIAVVPNGVELPHLSNSNSVPTPSSPLPAPRSPLAAPRSKLQAPSSKLRTVLFLGRIHPVKGLRDLIEAWAGVNAKNWRIVIAGNDNDGHAGELMEVMDARGLRDRITFPGPVIGASKWELYASADLFVLPSVSENFGIVVAEALASGVPVITTRGTPWRELADRRCGWCVEIGSEPLARALRDAVALSDEERREMGQRGRAWMEQEFSWGGVAEKMRAVYEWLLGRGSKPECILEIAA